MRALLHTLVSHCSALLLQPAQLQQPVLDYWFVIGCLADRCGTARLWAMGEEPEMKQRSLEKCMCAREERAFASVYIVQSTNTEDYIRSMNT